MRGEYRAAASASFAFLELPPRARRIHPNLNRNDAIKGTTSACAENTRRISGPGAHSGNYLRVRGEYSRGFTAFTQAGELPPRARRIPGGDHMVNLQRGTTSACAENTIVFPAKTGCYRNYLRVRGEYALRALLPRYQTELPPRARRIPVFFVGLKAHRWNYLRVRGEYSNFCNSPAVNGELPPRARRIQGGSYENPISLGTTSACAENTGIIRVAVSPRRNYLRVRGEYSEKYDFVMLAVELPPRARRIPLDSPHTLQSHGTTSACAENTRARLDRARL